MASSLQKQVLYRLLAAFLASGLVVIASTLWFQERALEGRVRARRQDLTDHFQGRIADIHREWEEHAAQIKQGLEFTRILETRRPDLLNAFFLTQSSNADFTYAVITDSRGALLLQYGADDEAKKALSRIGKQEPWFYYRAQKTLYHVFTVPVWLGNTETGFLYLLKPVDNALLGQIAYPRTDLYLLLDGQTVASSLGGRGIEQFPGVDGKAMVKGTRFVQASIPWTIPHVRSEVSPLLVIRTQIRDTLSGFEIATIVLASLAVLAVASWLLLGAWINGIIGNIVELKARSDFFARERKQPPTEAPPDERGERADELGSLKTGLAAMMLTVTESEQRFREGEEVLRRERDFSAGLVDTAPVIILLLDTQGLVQYVNPYFEHLTGYRMEEVKGRDWCGAFVPARDHERCRALCRTTGDGALIRSDITPILPRNGAEREIEWSGRAMGNGQDKVDALILIGLDITERRHVEEKYRTILQTAIDGFWTTDSRGRLLEVNDAYCRMSGYSRDELLSMSIPDLEALEKPEETAQHIEKIIALGAHRFETKHRRKDGTVYDVDASVQYSNQQGGAFIVFVKDATKRKRAEETVLAALAEKELLLKEIHHRVKNNLQIIASLLFLQAEEAGDPDTRELLRESRDRIKSMALVHEKLYGAGDLSRIDFMEYCGSLGAYLFSSYGAAKRGIHLETLGSGIYLNIDTAIPSGLIVSELLSNSLKHAFPGGRRGLVRITASLNDAGDFELTIGDNGAGLPRGAAFENADTLGLRLVQKLTAQLHGRIATSSDGGAVFHITIPLRGRKGKDPANG